MYVIMMVFCICVYDTVCTSYILVFTSQLVEKLFVINFDLSRGFLFSPCVLRWLSVYQGKKKKKYNNNNFFIYIMFYGMFFCLFVFYSVASLSFISAPKICNYVLYPPVHFKSANKIN